MKSHQGFLSTKKELLNMSTLKRIALALVIVGAINWGLIGLFQFDLVAAIFGGQAAWFSRIIYTLVGISGLISLSLFGNIAEDEISGDSLRSTDLGYGTEFADEEDIFGLGDDDDDDDLRQI